MHEDRISSPLINVYLTADHQSRRVIDDDGETHQVLVREEESMIAPRELCRYGTGEEVRLSGWVEGKRILFSRSTRIRIDSS